MANAKKIIRIVGIILLVIGLFIIILFSIYKIRYSYIDLIQIIPGVFLFVIGLVFLMASRKMILAANAKKNSKKKKAKRDCFTCYRVNYYCFFCFLYVCCGITSPRLGYDAYNSNNYRSGNLCYWISSSTSLKEKIFKIPR